MPSATAPTIGAVGRPRLGFVGVGWIGRSRMEAIATADVADITAIVEPAAPMAEAAAQLAPGAEILPSLDDLLGGDDIDGVVIATPSAFHCEQAIRALDRGISVFCQKPLGRTAAEVRAAVAAARKADRLLAVDMCYRYTDAMRKIGALVRGGQLGHVYAAELVFHNAYGPDKSWFYDPKLAGGGCVMDLGVHLVDLALSILDHPAVHAVSSNLYSGGRRLGDDPAEIEDYATATIELANGATVALSCSWNLHAGQDAVISASFHGTRGGTAMRNVNGSFYDFIAELYDGTNRRYLSEPPDPWGGRAAVDWAARLARGDRYDPSIEQLCQVADVLDRIYGRAPSAPRLHAAR